MITTINSGLKSKLAKRFARPTCLAVLALLFTNIAWAQDEPASSDESITIALIGDSTVEDYSGWGVAFRKRFNDSVTVLNFAKGGASSKNWYSGNRMPAVLEAKPDYVLIQFGHNDQPGKGPERETDPDTTYRDSLKRYAVESRSIGAQPILVSSVTRRRFDKDGKIRTTLTPWADATKAVAAELDVPFIDLHRRSIELHNRLGPEASMEFNFKQGDLTHFSEKGAAVMADLVIQELKTQVPGLARFLTTPSLPAQSDSSESTANRPLMAYVGTFSSPLGDVPPTQVDLPEGNGRGIHLFEVDRESGALKAAGTFDLGSSPDCLVINAARDRLYSSNETDRFGEAKLGSVSAFAIDPVNGQLTLLNTVSSEGDGPTYVSIHPSGKFLFVANYFSGSVAVLPILPDGRLGEATDVKKDTGTIGPTEATHAPPGSFAISGHDGSHAHMIEADPSGRFVLHVNLGLDKIFVWAFDASTGTLTRNDPTSVDLPAGDGPRHFDFHPNGRWLYSIQEEGSTVTLFDYAPSGGQLNSRQTVSSLPVGFAGSNFCSEILVSHDGRFVYAGNRLHDSIGIFAIESDGSLRQVGNEWTRGNYPRSFNFDPSGRFFYVCNQRADNVTVFRIDRDSGLLEFTNHYAPVGNPSSITFVDLAARDDSVQLLRRVSVPEAHQAVAVDESSFFAISNRTIVQYDKQTGKRLVKWVAPEGSWIKHLNSGIVKEGRLYCANSNWPAKPLKNSIEIFDAVSLKHLDSKPFSESEGAINWIDRHQGAWWIVFAFYGEAEVRRTKLVRYDDQWNETGEWTFPESVIQRFLPKSNSGGGFGPDGHLYVTGHDHAELYLLDVPDNGGELKHVSTLPAPIAGQGIAWDFDTPGRLLGIVRASREVVFMRVIRAK
ncbi:beta-propeller fold lactonase family protein [Rhodopirellula bahusiensis]|uniref:Cycloisomerase n=1 Tax=Rhodopirellula bahusiensis TaxID=2014065 RepID=A0A2G1W555_9BACT|nr:beta-propeller fold lactonase family protein [Rhodopirellula bahusiensis]PHQ34145.1 cycloisomerase [Rhodopirellula bahusiensis]